MSQNQSGLRRKDYFELIVDNPNQASPTFQFSWCVNKKGREELLEKKVLFPFLLVVVTVPHETYRGSGEWREERRILHPLDRGMGYIEFRRPGEYLIHASVIWSDDERNFKKARRSILDKYSEMDDNGNFKCQLHDGIDYRPSFIRFSKLPFHDKILIKVDENLFAPEPPKWQRKWVNLFWSGRNPKNECDFRKRKWFLAFTIQPFLVAIFLVFRTGLALLKAFWCLFVGMRPKRIYWSAIIHPFSWSIEDIADKHERRNKKNLWWITDSEGRIRPFIEVLLICPYFISILIVIFALNTNLIPLHGTISQLHNGEMKFFMIPSIIFGVGFVLSSAFFIYYFLSFIVRRLLNEKWFRNYQKKKEERASRRKEKKEASLDVSLSFYYNEMIEPLSCDKRPREATLKSLPASHRTFILRFNDFKHNVCRQFRG